MYYRDEIGNISTSNMFSHDEAVDLELRPRFPLFGGWQTRFYIGYNVPSYEYLYNMGMFIPNGSLPRKVLIPLNPAMLNSVISNSPPSQTE